MIWEHLYDEHDENTSNVVDVYIRYLRNKIDKDFFSAINHDPLGRRVHAPRGLNLSLW
jgi:DNA-binding response OmpR family regulator